MEKSTDTSLTATTTSSTSSSSSGSEVSSTKASDSSNTSTITAPSDVNQLHQKIQQQSSIVTKSTSTKNQVNNLLGCGLPTSSSATTTASTTPSSFFLDRGAACNSVGNNLKSSTTTTTNNDNNSNSNNKMSLNNTSTDASTTTTLLGHQSSNKTNLTNNAGIADVAVASTLSNSSASGSSIASASTSSSSSSHCNTTTSPSSSQMAPINLNISTTTGGNFSVSVDPQITVENLKKIIAKKLKVAKDRICLLHREKELQDGLLKENNLMDGSKIILIPNVETGLLAQRPENTVMQALESLNDSQVNDFLSGKTPLNLSMRLGDHMMLIQLQLSTVNPVNGVAHNGANCSSSSSRQRSNHHHHHHHRSSRTSSTATQTSTGGGGASSSSTTANHSHHHHHHHHHHHGTTTTAVASNASTSSTVVPPTAAGAVVQQHNKNATAVRKLELDTNCQTPRCVISNNTPSRAAAVNTKGSTSPSSTIPATTSIVAAASTKNSNLSSFLSKRDYESLQNIVKSIARAQVNTLQPTRLQQQQQQQQKQQTNTTAAQIPSSATVVNGTNTTSVPVVSTFHNSTEAVLLEQSPIKSLSNLVSSPIKTTAIKNIPNISNSNNTVSNISNNNNSNSNSSSSITNNAAIETHGTPSTMCQDPIAAKLTSCLCTRLNGGLNTMNAMSHASSKQCIETACNSSQQQQQLYQQHQQLQMVPHTTRTSTSSIMTSTPNCKASLAPAAIINSINRSTISSPPSTSSRPSFSLHKTAHNPIARKHRHHHHHHHHHHHYHHPTAVEELNPIVANPKIIFNTSTPNKTVSNDSGFNSGDDSSLNNSSVAKIPSSTFPAALVRTLGTPSSSASSSNPTGTATTSSITTPIELDDSGIVSDSRTLAEASRNLTQTLRKLSKEVFTNKIDFSASEETPRKSGSGAVIESMKNHGKGIYSGTFSGTLNPALQDRYGRPKRDISTVIHILNDLLSATPQYHRGARISFEAPSTSAAAASSVAAASGSTGAIHLNSRSKHLSSKHHQSSHPCVKCIKTHNSSSTTANFKSALTANVAAGTSASAQSTSSTICTYGECNGHYVNSKSQANKVYPCCQQETTTTVQQSLSSNNTAGAATTNGQHYHHHASTASSTSTASSHHHHHHHQMADERKVCQCRYRIHAETGERERDYTCPKCAAELDNIKTKSKLDQLRLVMQQRKQKREARKLKGAPYGARVVGTTTTATASGVSDNTAATLTASNSSIATPISVATSATTPSEVSPNHLVEEVDTAA